MNEYMIFYRTKGGELAYNWWNGLTLESAIDSASYDLQYNGEIDIDKTIKNYFLELYENEWDYVNKNLERGFLYIQFLKEKKLPITEECWQIDFSKIPCELVEEYKTYIREYMIKNLCYSSYNFEKEFTLENILEEFKNGFKSE